MSARLFVDGLPPSFTEQELATLFSGCGSVLSVQMTLLDGHSLGIAEVQMAAEEADRAIRELHHLRLDGKLLLVFRESGVNGTSQQVGSPPP